MAQFVDRLPSARLLPAIAVVVVAEDQVLLAIQPIQIRIVLGKREIAQVVNQITPRHDRVPAADHFFVHFLD